jgi:hypothetical protein
VTGWFSKRWAIQVSIAYASSSVKGFAPIQLSFATGDSLFGSADTAAHVIIGNARLVASILTFRQRGSVSIAAGWGFEARSGPAYRAFLSGETTNWGPAIGLRADYVLGRKTALCAAIDDQLFSVQFRDVAPTVALPYINQPASNYQEQSRRTQHDLGFSLGISFTTGSHQPSKLENSGS